MKYEEINWGSLPLPGTNFKIKFLNITLMINFVVFVKLVVSSPMNNFQKEMFFFF
jgi:hypothetical protein